MKDLLPGIITALLPLLLAALTFVSERLGQLIGAKVKNERIKGVLLRLDEEAFAVVREVAQTFADGLRKEGAFNTSSAQKAKAMALQKLKNRLGAGGVSELLRILGLDVEAGDSLIQGRIEAAVHSLKEKAPLFLPAIDVTPKEGAAAPPLPNSGA